MSIQEIKLKAELRGVNIVIGEYENMVIRSIDKDEKLKYQSALSKLYDQRKDVEGRLESYYRMKERGER